MVGAVKGCLFRSINFFIGIFKAKLEFLKWGWTLALFVQEKNPRIIFCYTNGGHVSEQYNIWGKSGEDLIKVAFDIKPVYPKTSTESLIQKQSQGTKPSVPEMKEPSFSDNPGHKPNSGSSLCQNFSDVLLLQCSLTLDCFRMATAALTFPYGNFPVLLFPGAASSSSHPLLVTLPSTTSHLSLYRFPSVLKTRCPLLCHPVFSLRWCSH